MTLVYYSAQLMNAISTAIPGPTLYIQTEVRVTVTVVIAPLMKGLVRFNTRVVDWPMLLHVPVHRLLEVLGNRIVDIYSMDRPVSELVSQKVYRVEVSVWCSAEHQVVTVFL